MLSVMNPTEPSSYEMHKEAMKKFRDRAERAEAELERVKKVCAEMREALSDLVGEVTCYHDYNVHGDCCGNCTGLTDAVERAEVALAKAKEAGL